MARRAQAGGKALIARPFRALSGWPGAAAIFASALCAFAASAQSRVTITATSRAVQVGDSSVSESIGSARYELSAAQAHLRIDASALRFRAPADSIGGRLPMNGLLDYSLRPGDTLSLYARTSSTPLDLSTRQTAALSIAGTSTVDLESAGFGTPAMGGAKAALSFPLGDLVLAARGGLEYEPRPDGLQPVYWRGTTVRGGLSLTSGSGDTRITSSFDVTHSSADSLGGRNLFPGGGTAALQLLADLSVPNPFDPLEDERWPVRAVAFYTRPFGNDRADQPNLIIPQGPLLGALATMLIPFGDLTASPSLQFLRESSQSESSLGVVRSVVSGSSWTLQSGIDVSIPLGSVFELTPQASWTFGSVSSAASQSAVLRRGRGVVRTTGGSEGIRGYSLSIQLSASM